MPVNAMPNSEQRFKTKKWRKPESISTTSSDTWKRIESRLIAARATLTQNGSVLKRVTGAGSVVWVVRYRVRRNGRTKQPVIYLGGRETADRASALIARWRIEAKLPDERFKSELLKTVKVQSRIAGLSGRGEKRLQRFVEGAMDNRLALCAFALGFMPVHDPMIRDGNRPGRPPKSGLW